MNERPPGRKERHCENVKKFQRSYIDKKGIGFAFRLGVYASVSALTDPFQNTSMEVPRIDQLSALLVASVARAPTSNEE